MVANIRPGLPPAACSFTYHVALAVDPTHIASSSCMAGSTPFAADLWAYRTRNARPEMFLGRIRSEDPCCSTLDSISER